MSKILTSIPTLVQSPFVIVTIADVTFGSYYGKTYPQGVQYPNYMKSLSVAKVNGIVNTYTITFEYQVRPGEDPNLLDKIFSKAAVDRRMSIKYGDWNAPTYIYKEEVAVITNLTSSLDMNNSKISYTLSAVSDAIGLSSTRFNFSQRFAKPSDIIFELISTNKYGLKDVFKGMIDSSKIIENGLIATNDKPVPLLAKEAITPLEYLNYLVNSMIPYSNDREDRYYTYYLTIHDDYTNDMGGNYFKVTAVSKNTKKINALDTYEVDVNYPGDNFVTQFSLNNDQSWAILYEFSEKQKQETYSYNITDDGKLETIYSPSLITSSVTNEISPTLNSWWAKMTSFPITATLTIKGLTRPSMLMTYVKVNVLFAGGVKHISSGLYIITKQVDLLTQNGYTTTLTLLRIGGDDTTEALSGVSSTK